jgi:hypothetical protein
MSQPDLDRTLREARPVAPAELRERVRLIAVQASPPRRQLVSLRRGLVLAVVVGAAVAAGVIATRPSHQAQQLERQATQPSHFSAAGSSALEKLAPGVPTATTPAPSANRLQQYTASLELRVPTTAAVSSDTQRAVAIAKSLGGYLAFVNVNTGGKSGYAEIRLRIPKLHVVEAVRRLSALGRIMGENVRIQDLQAGVNATNRLIVRLQGRLAALRTQPQTTLVQRETAALTTQIEQLQRGRSSTARSASYATVALSLSTPPAKTPSPHHHGPLHGLGTAFRWIAIVAVYGLAVGAPFLALAAGIWFAVRAIRRRREDSLLSRP